MPHPYPENSLCISHREDLSLAIYWYIMLLTQMGSGKWKGIPLIWLSHISVIDRHYVPRSWEGSLRCEVILLLTWGSSESGTISLHSQGWFFFFSVLFPQPQWDFTSILELTVFFPLPLTYIFPDVFRYNWYITL